MWFLKDLFVTVASQVCTVILSAPQVCTADIFILNRYTIFREDNVMGNFDDANVDKNLLSQIFADDDDDDILNGLLEETPEEIEKESEKQAEKKNEEDKSADKEKDKDTAESKDTKATDVKATEKTVASKEADVKSDTKVVAAETVIVKEDKKVSNDKENTSSKVLKESVAEDDIVRKEALKALEIERKNGTITTITEKTTINSSFSSDASLEVLGTIAGDIDCMGKVYISGSVLGSVTASEIYVNTPRLTGGLLSESIIRIGSGTIIIGDVTGTSAYIAGAVKGNIDVDGPVIIDSTAIIRGDIKAKSIKISEGAVIDGYVSLDYADVDLDKFFK